jgi:hypothetical protein
MPDIVVVSAWAVPSQAVEPFWTDLAVRQLSGGGTYIAPVLWGAQLLQVSESNQVQVRWLNANAIPIGGFFAIGGPATVSSFSVPANARAVRFTNPSGGAVSVAWRWQCRLG